MSTEPKPIYVITAEPGSPEYEHQLDDAIAHGKAVDPEGFSAALAGVAFALLGAGFRVDPALVEDAPCSYFENSTVLGNVNNLVGEK